MAFDFSAIREILFCVLGSLCFSVTMKVPRNIIKYVFIGALITSVCEKALSAYYGELIACMTAMSCLSLFCELVARSVKIPSTVVLMPSAIPLLPGSSIYYTMLYALGSNAEKFAEYGKSTLFAGLGISLGAVIAETVIKLFSGKNQNK